MLSFLQKHFLPVGLVTMAVVGFFFPTPGIYMAGLPTQYVAVSIIFLLSGLMLKTDEVHAALAAWKATSWGCVSILFATPLIGTAIAFKLPMEPSFQLGLALFCCMPTTLICRPRQQMVWCAWGWGGSENCGPCHGAL